MTKKLCFFIIFLSCSLVSLANASILVTVSTPTGNQNSGKLPSSSSSVTYKVVNEFNETLFRGGDLAVFMYETWCVASSSSSSSAQQQSSSSLSSARSNYNDSTKTNRTETETSSRPLIFVNQENVNGTLPGLGKYHGVRIRWTCSPITQPSDNNRNKFNSNNNNSSTPLLHTPISIPVVTSFLNFESQRAVVFDIEFPNGAENTSLALLRNNDNDDNDGSTATLATFPSFVMASSSEEGEGGKREVIPIKSNNKKIIETNNYFPPTFPSALSWEGSFVQSVRGLSTGPQGGPTVFYNASDPSLKNVVVVSQFFFSKTTNNPHHSLIEIRQHNNTENATNRNTKSNTKNHWSTFTAGNKKDWTGRNSAFSPGISGRIKTIPAGFSQSIILYEGSQCGITATLDEWGSIMQKTSTSIFPSVSTSTPTSKLSLSSRDEEEKERNKIKDVTLEKIGYQTDNGAMYCFCQQKNCSEVLLHEKEYLDSIRIPIGYLSFQGAGTSSGRGKAAP
jgi:hypothetical protein